MISLVPGHQESPDLPNKPVRPGLTRSPSVSVCDCMDGLLHPAAPGPCLASGELFLQPAIAKCGGRQARVPDARKALRAR